MTADGFELRGMSPTDLLVALADLAEDLEKLWESGLLGRLKSGVLAPEPFVFLPADAASLPAAARLIEMVRRYSPGFAQAEVQLQDDAWLSLPVALPHFLISSGADDPEKAQPEAGEYLLIDRRGDLTKAVGLCEDLRFHATHCRLAGARHNGADYYLFHVVADPDRRSSFDSFAAGDGLAGLDRLSAFRTGGQTLFFPPRPALSRRALDAFRRILLEVPRIHGLGENVATAENLLAVAFAQGRSEVFPLASLHFADQAELTPGPSPGYEMELLPLTHSEEALSSLRDGIHNARPLVGYRLELRPGYPTAELKQQLERLAEELTELEQRRVYLESFLEPRPILCRYSQSQLPALADQLRSFPVTELRSGKIRYGFQATEERPAGWHFLLYAPSEAVTAEKVPPWHWKDLDELDATMYFWLDPLWAAHYHGKGGCLVFVPQGSTLFPTLHSRRPEEMDAYLRDLLLNWFPGEEALDEVPSEALYVFDEIRSGGQTEIRIQVLDRRGFRVLQEEVGWLNDNLRLQQELGGVRELIAELADADSRYQLARRFTRRAKESEADFETVADAANQKMAAGATELLRVLTEEVQQITERCKTAFDEIQRMQDVLGQAEASLASLSSLEKEIDQEVKTLRKTAAENVGLVEELEKELKDLEEKRGSIETTVSEKIEVLGRTLKNLRQRVRSS